MFYIAVRDAVVLLAVVVVRVLVVVPWFWRRSLTVVHYFVPSLTSSGAGGVDVLVVAGVASRKGSKVERA